jgi:hypothetical protein
LTAAALFAAMRRSGFLPIGLARLFACAFLCLVAASALPQKVQLPSGCEACHESQARVQPDTLMGRAIEPSGDNPVLQAHPLLTLQKGGYTYTVETHNGHSTYSVSDGSGTISVPIVWNFGAGNQTWLLERRGRFYESLVSYYTAIEGLDTTTGDASIIPTTLEQAFGRELDDTDTRACFGCHSTNSMSNGQLAVAVLHPGVACARCHLDAEEHQSSMASGELTVYPPDLKRLSSEDLSTLCGQCHRTWEMVVRSHWRGEANVRFQPYRLANSRCFDGSDPRISCIACHDPHQQLVHDLAFYDSKCLACHGTAAHPGSRHRVAHSTTPENASGASATEPKSCPVAISRCVGCHMPRGPMLGGHLSFTDHQIRIVRPGDAYPN